MTDQPTSSTDKLIADVLKPFVHLSAMNYRAVTSRRKCLEECKANLRTLFESDGDCLEPLEKLAFKKYTIQIGAGDPKKLKYMQAVNYTDLAIALAESARRVAVVEARMANNLEIYSTMKEAALSAEAKHAALVGELEAAADGWERSRAYGVAKDIRNIINKHKGTL